MMKKAMVLIGVMVLVLGLAGMAGAYTISDDATGGDCTQIGTWDSGTRTCTLTQDLTVGSSAAIKITDNGITIDGNGHTITGTSIYEGGAGVAFSETSDITVKNLTVTGVTKAIYALSSNNLTVMDSSFDNNYHSLALWGSRYATIINSSFSGSVIAAELDGAYGDFTFEGNTFTGNVNGIIIDGLAPDGVINNNTFDSGGYSIISKGDNIQITNNLFENEYWAISIIMPPNGVLISNNQLLSNQYGIHIYGAGAALLSGNTVSGSIYGILFQGYLDYITGDITLTENTISDNLYGLYILNTSGHLIYHNNFIKNQHDLAPLTTTGNVWSLDLPEGGNYWDRHDSPAEGCTDNNGDSICDQPYGFNAGTDYFPWAKAGGWLCQSAPSFVVGSFSPEAVWPADHRSVDITITGQVVVPNGCTLTDASFSLTDEYGEYSSSGALEVAADGSFSLTLPAEATRTGSDRDGRTYTLVLSATDDAGTSQSAPLISTVLHDMRK